MARWVRLHDYPLIEKLVEDEWVGPPSITFLKDWHRIESMVHKELLVWRPLYTLMGYRDFIFIMEWRKRQSVVSEFDHDF